MPDSKVAEVMVRITILATSPMPPTVIDILSHWVLPYSFESVATSPTEIRGRSTINVLPRENSIAKRIEKA